MEISGLFIFKSNPYFFLAAFTILGAGIKYVDDAFDEGTFAKNTAILVAPVLGVLWAYTALSHEVAATLLLAVLLGVLLKGKIDNLAHQLGFVTIIALLFLAGAEVMIVALIFLTLASLIDEVGNDIMDEKMRFFNYNGPLNKFLLYFFEYRCLMKTVALLLAILGVFPLYFLIAFLLFDGAYHVVRLYSQSRQELSIHKTAPGA